MITPQPLPMRLLIGFLLIFTAPVLRAQMDRNQLLDQIAKLQLYIAEAEKGYQIVQVGLSSIGAIKQGDFNLHQFFFSSLQLVNPAVRSYIRVADMVTMQAAMLASYTTYYQQVAASKLFNASELSYIYQHYIGILGKTAEDISELTSILTDGEWQMDDAQRLGRIDQLYARVTEQCQSLYQFNHQVQLLALQKRQTASGLQNLTQLFQP
jgi:hypothetical protein